MPIGWVSGPMLVVDGESEGTACTTVNGDAALVEMFLGNGKRDAAPVAGLLGALQHGRVAQD